MKAPRIGLASSPHKIQQIYYSSNIAPILGADSFATLPVGTVAVKEQSRDGDAVIDQIMVMVKQPLGTDPTRGDWIWEQRQPKTLKLVSSSETNPSFRDFCAGCHVRYSGSDWLAGTSITDF